MLSVGRDRFARVLRIVAIAAVVVMVIVLVLNAINKQTSLTQNGMMQRVVPGGYAEKTVGSAGVGLSVPMMDTFGETASAPVRGMMGEGNALVQSGGDTPTIDKKVIKTGNLTLKVESLEKTQDQLQWVASQFGGDIFASSLYDATNTTNGVKRGMVTLKVPVEHFDEAMRSIKSAARVVVNETTQGQDVASEYVDLQARLKNKQAEEASIAAILTRDTNKIDDVLQVTIELARVRGEIEQLQAQVKYLDNQSALATITVSFTEDTQIGKADTTWRPTQEIKDAVNALIKAGQKVVSFLISFIIVVVPVLGVLLLIAGGILYVIVKKLYRRFNR